MTKEKVVLTNTAEDVSLLSPCSQEEADTRLLLHTSSCAGKCIIKTVDTDVVVISVAHYFEMAIEELWVELGTSNVIFYPIHDIAQALGPSMCKALLFFHAFTGCDTVSSFLHIGKKTAWNVFVKHKTKFEEVFVQLCSLDHLDDHKFAKIQEFVCLMYCKDAVIKTVNKCRLLMHRRGIGFDRLPPTASALYQHTLRTMLQSNVWNNSLSPTSTIRDPTGWGWRTNADGTFLPHWTDLPAAVSLVEHFKKCACKSKCSKKRGCSCKLNNIKCTSLCKCDYELCNDTILAED